jgi:DNA-binding CsgD family transcriptional regulator
VNTTSGLTRQESNVLALVAKGKRNAEIAQELYLSVNTVESHLYRIFQKLNVSSRTAAALYALQNGLLSMPKFTESTDDNESRHNYYKEGHKVNGSSSELTEIN